MTQDPILKDPESPIFDQTSANSILEPIINETIRELDQYQSKISRGALINNIIKNVMDHSLDIKLEKQILKEVASILKKKIELLDEDIKEAELKLKQKANKKVRWFTNFLIAELALLHYFIYFNLSWDIMEPITVIIANLDIMAAYWFFIVKGTPFSPSGWQSMIFTQHKYRHLVKAGIDIQKYEEYL